MIDAVETGFYVSFDEPARAIPGLLDGTECCVAASSRAKPMGMVTELAVVVGFQNVP